jgi:phospholipase/carboxylesterase
LQEAPIGALRGSAPHRAAAWGGAASASFAPQHYEAGYAYPLLVWLHDAGGNEQQLRRMMPRVSMRNYVAIAPRGTLELGRPARPDRRRPPSGPAPSLRQRVRPAKVSGFDWEQTDSGIEEAAARVFGAIESAAQRYHIHPSRIFLAGSGSGGTMALRIGWSQPRRFAGLASLGGPVPTDLCPLRCVNEIRRLPLLVATARQSRFYPEQRACDDLRLLHAAGCTVALRQYPGGDELTDGILADLNRWIMELVCGEG